VRHDFDGLAGGEGVKGSKECVFTVLGGEHRAHGLGPGACEVIALIDDGLGGQMQTDDVVGDFSFVGVLDGDGNLGHLAAADLADAGRRGDFEGGSGATILGAGGKHEEGGDQEEEATGGCSEGRHGDVLCVGGRVGLRVVGAMVR